MHRTRIKICGITSVKDALLAAELGADAIGLNFYAKSKRYITIAQAQEIMRALPAFVNVVGLFVDATHEQVQQTLQQIKLNTLQLHGQETPEFCASFAMSYIKALRVDSAATIKTGALIYPNASALLLDAHVVGQVGGTGAIFDWQLIPKDLTQPIILAGGLTPDNVTAAIKQARPYAVDVTSGVEASPGIKDPIKLRAFFQAVYNVDSR